MNCPKCQNEMIFVYVDTDNGLRGKYVCRNKECSKKNDEKTIKYLAKPLVHWNNVV